MSNQFNGCEVNIDITKLEHIPQESCYNNNWYKSDGAYFFVHCLEQYNQVDIYFSKTLGGSKEFLISSEWNEYEVYSGELGKQWT